MQLWPPLVEPGTLTSWVTDDATAQALPGVGRALSLYSGLIGQMELDQVKDGEPMRPRPRVLQRPDPALARFNFIGTSIKDWWVHGNALSLITTRDFRGIPSSVRYFPPWAWSIVDRDDRYYLHGRPVDPEDVLHVQRGVDPANPRRGIGVVEQHLRSLKRAGLQERYEENALSSGGVPSVAVIAPQKEVTKGEADDAAKAWEDRFAGPVRKPAILPNGTEVKTLSWNPNDQQMVMARQLTLTDLSDIFNLDPYWLGAPGSSHTYRSAGSMFVALLRVSLEPVMAPFEDVYARVLTPYGSEVRFDRRQLTRDDLATMVTTGVQAVNAGLIVVDEWRELMGWKPFGTEESTTPRVGGPPTEEPGDTPEADPDVEIEPIKEGSNA
jgi:HK97 family phage portal protein